MKKDIFAKRGISASHENHTTVPSHTQPHTTCTVALILLSLRVLVILLIILPSLILLAIITIIKAGASDTGPA